jgi:hypothetical protein
MVIFGKLITTPELQQRVYTDKYGKERTFDFRTVNMDCGKSRMVGEMVGEAALSWPYTHLCGRCDNMWIAEITLCSRPILARQGGSRLVCMIRVNRMVPFFSRQAGALVISSLCKPLIRAVFKKTTLGNNQTLKKNFKKTEQQ